MPRQKRTLDSPTSSRTSGDPQPDRSLLADANFAELLVSKSFATARNQAYEAAAGNDELYVEWRHKFDPILAEMALLMTTRPDTELPKKVWGFQLDVAINQSRGNTLGPFSEYPMRATIGGRKAEVEPASDDISHLPPGESGIVATNSMIVGLSRREPLPLDLLHEGMKIIRTRRQEAKNFEGPENYATLLKLAADKTFDYPVADDKDSVAQLRKLVDQVMGGFLRISEKDTPNVVEMTNILSSVKALPKGTFDEKFTAAILRYSLVTLPDFTQGGINLLMSAIAKLDVSSCGETAANTIDLALRKGAKFERSGEMRTSLRAVANLPKSRASNRAFSTLLDVRSQLEVAADIDSLDEINERLRFIVEHVIDDRDGTGRAQKIAKNAERSARELVARKLNEGSLTQEAVKYYNATLTRIAENARAM